MKLVTRLLGLIVGVLALLLLTQPPTAHAQPVVTDAFPAPDSAVDTVPQTVVITFDRLIEPSSVRLVVRDSAGLAVNLSDAGVDPERGNTIRVSIPALNNGSYRVEYRAAALGSPVIISGSYGFDIALPTPELFIISPADGASLEPGPMLLEMQVRSVDFTLYDTRIVLYVNDEPVTELTGLTHEFEFEPGIYEIRAVMSQLGSEIEGSTNVITVAVHETDAELAGREAAAAQIGDAGTTLSLPELLGLGAAGIALLGFGWWLGSATPS